MKRTTIHDVARVAGVSIKTVSRVLNDEPHVSAGVRLRVREAAGQLDYHPNILAQALVQRRTHIIGLVYERPSPSYVVELQRGMMQRLAGTRYRVIVLPVGSVAEDPKGAVALIRSAPLDGVVLSPPAADHELVLSQLQTFGLRYTRIAPTEHLDQGGYALMDDVGAAHDIAALICRRGHRRVAIVIGDPTHPSCAQRMRGYRAALTEHGVTVPDRWTIQGNYTFDSGYVAGERLLRDPDRPTAILAMNDDMAVGAMMAARALGIAVPDALSIAGFDDSEISRLALPTLTTIRQPVFAMAEAATAMLLAQIDGDPVPTGQMLPHALIERDSTGPAPARN